VTDSRSSPSRVSLHKPFLLFGSAVTLLVTILALVLPGFSQEPGSGERFTRLSRRATEAREANRLAEALPLYKQALALRPGWAEGWWSVGTIYYDQDAYDKAATAFQQLLRVDPKHGTGHAMLGLCQFELGQDAPALRNIQTGLALGLANDDSLRRVVLYHQGVLLLRQGKFGSAQNSLSKMAGLGVQDEAAMLALGMAVLRIRPAELPAEDPGRELVLRAGRAEALGQQKKAEEGKAIYEQLIAEAPQFPNLHYAYGRYLLPQQRIDEAIAQFQQEVQNYPKALHAYLELAAAEYHLDSEAGVKYGEQAVKLDPTLPFGHFLLGLLYVDCREYEKGIAELTEAERGQIREPELYYALGTAYSRLGRASEAARARSTFLRLDAQRKAEQQSNIYGERKGLMRDAPSGEGKKQP
jgi:tetratricopeptide (TPR) repeat protein